MKKICGIQWHHVRLLRHDLENWGWGRRPYFWDFGEREEAEERWNCSAQNCVFDSSSSNTKENRRHCFILMVNCKVREVRSNRVEIHAAIVHVFDSLPVEYFQRRIQCLQCWQSTLESRIIVYTRNLILKIFRDTRSYSGHTRSRRRRKISNFLLFEDLFIGKFLENEFIHNELAYALCTLIFTICEVDCKEK